MSELTSKLRGPRWNYVKKALFAFPSFIKFTTNNLTKRFKLKYNRRGTNNWMKLNSTTFSDEINFWSWNDNFWGNDLFSNEKELFETVIILLWTKPFNICRAFQSNDKSHFAEVLERSNWNRIYLYNRKENKSSGQTFQLGQKLLQSWSNFSLKFFS